MLFVEDEESISGPFSSALTREGFDPVVAASLAEARDQLSRGLPDLVLLDLMLPDGDGRDLARELRAASEVPIIMLTARGTELERVVGLELGADDYVVKPFSGAEVIARMRAVLRRVRPVPAASDAGGRAAAPGARLAAGVPRRRGALAVAQGVRPAGRARRARRRGRHPRGPDLAGVGRELVRVDEDPGRPHRLAARQARRRRRLRRASCIRCAASGSASRGRRSGPVDASRPSAAGARLRARAGDRVDARAAGALGPRPHRRGGAPAGVRAGRGRRGDGGGFLRPRFIGRDLGA